MRSRVRLLRCLLIEARDWLFAIAAFVTVTGIYVVVGDWRLATAALLGFVFLYIASIFATSRWIRGPGSSR